MRHTASNPNFSKKPEKGPQIHYHKYVHKEVAINLDLATRKNAENGDNKYSKAPTDMTPAIVSQARNKFNKLRKVISRNPKVADFLNDFSKRVSWLVGLMIMQSASSFILEKYSTLIQSHLIITLFLTMLIGAGGNAGNQSTVIIVRAIATSDIYSQNKHSTSSMVSSTRDDAEQNSLGLLSRRKHHQVIAPNVFEVVFREFLLGVAMGIVLFCVAFLRVYLSHRQTVPALAISTAMFWIVVTATTLGTALPLAFARFKVDPAHAGPAIQVIMDITGVIITCFICGAFFDLAQRNGWVIDPTASSKGNAAVKNIMDASSLLHRASNLKM